MATRVILVRHGQSTYNAQQKIQGRCNESTLTEIGRQDADKVGAALKGIPFDVFYHSPLQRAAQTAQIIHEHFPETPNPQAVDSLMEVDLPLWEKLGKTEVREKFTEAYQNWKQRPHEFFMELENGQKHYPVLSLYDQAKQFWQMLLSQHQGQTVLVVAHNGINRCLIMSALGMNPSRYHTIQQSNCCINVLNFAGGWGDSVQLESLNQVAHMGLTLPPPRPAQTPLRLLLVRHGETNWNRESRFQGTMDIPLNEKGREQARKAAEHLKGVKIDFGITSPMLRPKETAELILEHHSQVSLETRDRLLEIGHGTWEGKLESEIEAAYPGMLQQWKTAPETVQMPEGENLQQVWDRAIATWQEIVQQYSNPPTTDSPTGIVVAHDAINKTILCWLLGLEPKDIWKIKQGNGAISVIDYPDGSNGLPVLQTINLTAHLGFGVIDKTAAGAL
ncbi:histidine phosphatase family protein [Spirulina sp. CS-785/01]|uniref:histidine phosphatase family protein n=1 Tax=Spirulina sp. CS-785/01 TaxID=3021716 RepID=UPI00232C4016|nr:histidine phosphatase family protein [Spirulina sp. CS-785/01]MDB9315651.1 histidine phosphatase family protein [Spirulina sp. CS-785/01]